VKQPAGDDDDVKPSEGLHLLLYQKLPLFFPMSCCAGSLLFLLHAGLIGVSVVGCCTCSAVSCQTPTCLPLSTSNSMARWSNVVHTR
jgi:hypothetical protein